MTHTLMIDRNSAESAWVIARPYIARCDTEISKADDLYPLIQDGRRTLMLIIEDGSVKGACIAREIIGFNKTVVVTTLGGDGADWDAAIKDLEAQMKALGYDRLEVQGRKGWGKCLSGYDEMYTTIGKWL